MMIMMMTFREIKTFTTFSLNFFMLIRGTNYGHMMAIFKNLFNQYHIWHGLWTTNEGITQRNLKIWADVADKKCSGST